jgi:hypothetical protein
VSGMLCVDLMFWSARHACEAMQQGYFLDQPEG